MAGSLPNFLPSSVVAHAYKPSTEEGKVASATQWDSVYQRKLEASKNISKICHCISYFYVTVIRCHGQRGLKSQKDKFFMARNAWHGSRNRKLLSCTHRQHRKFDEVINPHNPPWSRLHLLKTEQSSQTMLSTDNSGFKYMSLWGTFLILTTTATLNLNLRAPGGEHMWQGLFLKFPYLSKKIAPHLVAKEEIEVKLLTSNMVEPGPRLVSVLKVIYLPQNIT